MCRRAAVLALTAAALAFSSRAFAQTEPPAAAASPGPAVEPVATERVTFDEAVRRALEKSPTVGQATQAIARAQALLDQASAVFRPTLDAVAGTTVIDEARGFSGNITQPRTQTAMGARLAYPVLAPGRWAERTQARDRVGIARISEEETRRQVALTAGEAYLAVIAARRQMEIAQQDIATSTALAEYARLRLDAGQGSRLNYVRSTQEVATSEGRLLVAALAVARAQEALGVVLFADGPVDASGDPQLAPAALPSPDGGDAWLQQRPDIRLFEAEVRASDRIVRDVWKSYLPSATAGFSPQYVTPPGFFAPAGTWAAVLQLQVPIYDGTFSATKRLRIAERETAQLQLEAVKVEARSELRFAQEAVARNEQIVTTTRRSAADAEEVLRITEVAYRAGATTNIEVVQAQQTARNAELLAAVAEDRLRQARLDLLVALGQFPQ
jgi:outer membrane protein TolC